jgi:CheY-like chemotaxis protein
MDGFDLTRNIRADKRLKAVPVIMITSRTAEKHKRYAEEIGVNTTSASPTTKTCAARPDPGFRHPGHTLTRPKAPLSTGLARGLAIIGCFPAQGLLTVISRGIRNDCQQTLANP